MAVDPTVHVIDDDEAVRDAVRLLLAGEGFVVRAHESGRAFLDTVRRGDRGCVVTDVRMPEISGLDLLAALRERRVSMPVIVMTAHADIPLAVAAMRQGAVDFFEKPFDGDGLLAAIRSALAGGERQGETRPAKTRPTKPRPIKPRPTRKRA